MVLSRSGSYVADTVLNSMAAHASDPISGRSQRMERDRRSRNYYLKKRTSALPRHVQRPNLRQAAQFGAAPVPSGSDSDNDGASGASASDSGSKSGVRDGTSESAKMNLEETALF